MIVNLVRRVHRRFALKRAYEQDKKHLGPLYQPHAFDLDHSLHIAEAIEWLKRAQDAGSDRGISYGVRFGQDFDVSYPETTGYICQTFVEQEQRTGNEDFLQRAIQMADWEISIQLPEGAVMGGKVNRNPSPAVFNTGMVLLGWASLINRTGEERFKQAALRAGNWLMNIQEANGNWISGNSQFASRATLYNVKAAWGLCEAGFALGEDRFIKAAIQNAEYCAAQQQANGWFPHCCLSDPKRPLLHTIAYAMQGLAGIAKLTDRRDFLAAAQKSADAEMRIMADDGFIPGRQDSEFQGAVDWCCLTGSAQTSIVWSELYLKTGMGKYREAVKRVNHYLITHHDIRNQDARLRGGVPGSWPVWGDYGRLTILNWATKFFVDALTLEDEMNVRQEHRASPGRQLSDTPEMSEPGGKDDC